MLEAENERKKIKSELSSKALVMLSSIIKARQESRKEKEQNPFDVEYLTNSDSLLEHLMELNQAIKDEERLNSISPSTGEEYVDILKAQRKRLIKRMWELHQKESNSENHYNRGCT